MKRRCDGDGSPATLVNLNSRWLEKQFPCLRIANAAGHIEHGMGRYARLLQKALKKTISRMVQFDDSNVPRMELDTSDANAIGIPIYEIQLGHA